MENLDCLRMRVTINAAALPKSVLKSFEKIQRMYPKSVKIVFTPPSYIESQGSRYSNILRAAQTAVS